MTETSTEPIVETPVVPPAVTAPETDWQAETEKWKALAQKHEARSKSNATAQTELEKLKTSQLSDTEKAVQEAEDRGRLAATSDFGTRIAVAELKAALTGIVPSPAEIVADLNIARYVTDTGDVDEQAVTALRERYAALIPTKPAVPDLKQGRVGEIPKGQLPRSALTSMSPDDIVAAEDAGLLDDVLGVK